MDALQLAETTVNMISDGILTHQIARRERAEPVAHSKANSICDAPPISVGLSLCRVFRRRPTAWQQRRTYGAPRYPIGGAYGAALLCRWRIRCASLSSGAARQRCAEPRRAKVLRELHALDHPTAGGTHRLEHDCHVW